MYYLSHACPRNYNCRFCDAKMYLCINNGKGTVSGVVLAGTGRERERHLRERDGNGKKDTGTGREWDRKCIPVQNSTCHPKARIYNFIYSLPV